MGRFRQIMVRCLRLPPDPHPPAGSEESVRVFRAAPGYYRYALARWGLRQVGVVVGVLFVIGFWQPLQSWVKLEMPRVAVEEIRSEIPGAAWAERWKLARVRPFPDDPDRVVVSFGPMLFWLEMFGFALVLVQMIVTFTLVRLDYELRWYIVTDRSLRIREGVTSLHESTMTFANIQNLTIEQGPIQRVLGIADLRVRTAGGGSGKEGDSSGERGKSESMHVGYLRGIDNAPALRETILDHVRQLEDDGLGDEERPAVGTGVESAVEAARAVLVEARAMRATIRARR